MLIESSQGMGFVYPQERLPTPFLASRRVGSMSEERDWVAVVVNSRITFAGSRSATESTILSGR